MRGGIDEVGRGCLVGPMIFCLVSSRDQEAEEKLRSLGVKDSKLIKDPIVMKNIAKYIKKSFDVKFIEGSPELIDHYVNYSSLNELSLELVKSILSDDIKEVCIDSLGNSERYLVELQKEFKKMNIEILEKAESKDPFCAAASICAKDRRNDLLKEINLSHKVGSGYPSDPILKKFISENLESIRRKELNFIRYSWKSVSHYLDTKE